MAAANVHIARAVVLVGRLVPLGIGSPCQQQEQHTVGSLPSSGKEFSGYGEAGQGMEGRSWEESEQFRGQIKGSLEGRGRGWGQRQRLRSDPSTPPEPPGFCTH